MEKDHDGIVSPLKRNTVIKQMHITRNSGPTATSSAKPKTVRKPSRLPLNTLEYSIIANLVVQQYQQGDVIRFDALLSIPLGDRIPGLMEKYVKKTMHKLLVMILKEFCHSLPLTKAKKLTETKISMAAC